MSDDLVKRFDRRGAITEYNLLYALDRNPTTINAGADICAEAKSTILAQADRIEELEAKQKKAAQYFAEIIMHCANFGRGVPSIDERIIERCEETAANAIEYLAGGKDEDV